MSASLARPWYVEVVADVNGLEAAAAWFGGDRGPEARARQQMLKECPHPLALAMRLDQSIVSVPAMELISKTWVDTMASPDGRAVLSTPAQQGKSTIARFAILWALLDDPDRRIIFASYGVSLARATGRMVRDLIEQHGDRYGLRLDQSKRDATDWKLERHRAGCSADRPPRG